MFDAVVTTKEAYKALFSFAICNQVQCDNFLEIESKLLICGGQHFEDFALRFVGASFANRQAVLRVGTELRQIQFDISHGPRSTNEQ
jgi:hypothetical protein